MDNRYKRGYAFGILLILIAIAIGIFFQNDIGFLFGGVGTIIIGITLLMHMNEHFKKQGLNEEKKGSK